MSSAPPLIPDTEYYPINRKIGRGELIPHNPGEDAIRHRYIVNKIIIGDITYDEAVILMKDDYHAPYRLRKLLSGDFLNAGYDDLDYDYIRHKWHVRKDFYKKGWFKIMHPYYKRYFPNIKPKKLGRGETVTIINKDGSSWSYNIQNHRNVVARVLINEPLDSDFTLDKIRFADAYDKVQYWKILRHNQEVDVAQSKGMQILDALTTGISVSLDGIYLSKSLTRLGFSVAKAADTAISKVRVKMLHYRLHKMRSKVIPGPNKFPMKTFKEYKYTFSKMKPLDSQLPQLERRLIQTQHKTVNVRINRKRKIVSRVRYKETDLDAPPNLKDIKKIRKQNKGKVNIGPARGMQTPIKLKRFNELKIRTPGENYSMIHRGSELNIPPRAPFRQKVIKHRAWLTELKQKYGLKRGGAKRLTGKLLLRGAAEAASRVRFPPNPIGSIASGSLADSVRSGQKRGDSRDRGLDRDSKKDPGPRGQPIGGIILPSTRRRKNRQNRRGFFRR